MVVCHCRRVSERSVHAALAAGAPDVRSVVRATHAGTGCGGCVGALRELIESTLGPAAQDGPREVLAS